MSEEWQALFEWLRGHWGYIVFLLGCFLEITPIKINPLSAIGRWFGKLLTADLMAEITNVKEEQTKQRKEIEENERDRIRYEILDFANSCRHNRKHTKDEFDHIIALNGKYERLMKKVDEPNGVYSAEYEYIKELYHMCQRENKFLV